MTKKSGKFQNKIHWTATEIHRFNKEIQADLDKIGDRLKRLGET